MRSPRIAPPVNGRGRDRRRRCRRVCPACAIRLREPLRRACDLPAPGGPVIPTTRARPGPREERAGGAPARRPVALDRARSPGRSRAGCPASDASGERCEADGRRADGGASSTPPSASRLLRDHEPLDLARALADRAELDVAVELLDREVLDEAVAAVDLDARARCTRTATSDGVELGLRRRAASPARPRPCAAAAAIGQERARRRSRSPCRRGRTGSPRTRRSACRTAAAPSRSASAAS